MSAPTVIFWGSFDALRTLSAADVDAACEPSDGGIPDPTNGVVSANLCVLLNGTVNATLLAGLLGKTATVAHSVCLNLASITFMVPLGIGLAATTRVGNLIGERRASDAQHSSHLALILGALCMAALGSTPDPWICRV